MLHRHAPAQQHSIGIAGAVADRQDGKIGGDVARRRAQSLEPAVGDVQVFDPAGEADFAAQRFKLAPEGANHERKPVRAQVRAVLVDDRRPAVALGEDFQDARHIGARAARRELAVAEGPGPALAEEVIAFGIERPVLIESADVGDAILDGAAALEDERLIPGKRQQIAGEKAGRAGADDHRAMTHRLRAGLGPLEVVRSVCLGHGHRAAKDAFAILVGKLDRGRVGEMNIVVAAGVEALANDPPAKNRICGDCQPAGDLGRQALFRLSELQADIRHLDRHGRWTCAGLSVGGHLCEGPHPGPRPEGRGR